MGREPITQKQSAGEPPLTGSLPPLESPLLHLNRSRFVSRAEFEGLRTDATSRDSLLRELAEDILQPAYRRWIGRCNRNRPPDLILNDCLLAIDRLIQSFDPARGVSLERYVRCHIRNRVIDIWRQENDGRHSVLPLEYPDTPAPQTEEHPVDRRDATQHLLRSLKPIERRIVNLRMTGLGFKEVAERIGISESILYGHLRELRTRTHQLDDAAGGGRTDFARFLARLTDPERRPVALDDVVTGPDFFARYLPQMSSVFAFKRAVRTRYAAGIDVLGAAAPHLYRYIETTYGGVDLIPARRLGPIARLLGTDKNHAAILLSLHERGACPLTVPTDPRWHTATRYRNHRTPYFNPAVVGAHRARANIDAHLAVSVPDLTALEDRGLVRHASVLLGAEAERGAVARRCIARGIVSPVRPPVRAALDGVPEREQNHRRRRSAESIWSRGALYFDASVVGAEAAARNLQAALRSTVRSLDDVTRSSPLAAVLGCPNTIPALVQTLAAERYLGTTPPTGTPLIRPDGRLSRYADETLLGFTARPTFERLFRATFRSVDDLPWRNPALAGVFNCADNVRSVFRAALERDLLPGTIPPGHPTRRPDGSPTRYLLPAIVGADHALESLRAIVTPLVPNLDTILDRREVARILQVKGGDRAIARRCITLGLVDGAALPTTQILRPTGELSHHIDPRVRRRRLALNDLQMIINAQGIGLAELAATPQIARLLRCAPSPAAITAALRAHKITPQNAPVPTELAIHRELHPAFDRTVTPYPRWQANMRHYLGQHFSSLDDLTRDHYLATALGCADTARDIAAAVVHHRLLSWRAPLDFSLFGVSGGSRYVDPAIIGDDRRVALNIRRSLRGVIVTLDDVFQSDALSSALGCARNAGAIAAALVERGIASPVLPHGHPFTIGKVRSRYFEPEIVGPVQLQANIGRFLAVNAPTLDDLPMIDALCNTLGVERRRHALAQAVVEAGLIDWRLPPGHDVQRAGGSLYLNIEVVGRERLEANLRAYILDRYNGDLEQLPRKSKSLSSALDVPNNKGSITQALIERRIISL